jgi:Xaa-Pro aminopeptidase
MSAAIARLLYAASEHDADMLYATRFFVPDAFLWWSFAGRTNAVLSPLEIGRARRQARIDRIWAAEDFLPPSAKERDAAALIAAVARRSGFRRIKVSSHFPAGLMEKLKRKGLKIEVADGLFFPERMIKRAEEIKALERGVRLAEEGLARGLEILKTSRKGRGRVLRWAGKPLTSERLRGEIDAAIIRQGGLPAGTIVAGGDQACDPHDRGSGVLRANEAIILDIFPRDQRSGYYGDLTRTVVRGRASEALRRLYGTVAEGKRWVMKQVKAGADGKRLHDALVERFREAGYATEKKRGIWQGFFHGTGHGLGLEIHEAPRFGAGKLPLHTVITVEPGLYYPGLGGIRLEDVVVVEKNGVRNLTRARQVLEI